MSSIKYNIKVAEDMASGLLECHPEMLKKQLDTMASITRKLLAGHAAAANTTFTLVDGFVRIAKEDFDVIAETVADVQRLDNPPQHAATSTDQPARAQRPQNASDE